MRRKLRIFLVAIAIIGFFAVFAGDALAAWVGSLRADVQIEEPIVVLQALIPTPETIYPGETFGFGGEIRNSSSVTYGIRLHGFLWFWWVFEGTEKVAEISLEDLPASGEINFSGAAAPPQGPYFGTVEIYLNDSYYPSGSVINIGPGESHEVRVVVTTSYAAPVGRLTAEVFAIRGAPVR